MIIVLTAGTILSTFLSLSFFSGQPMVLLLLLEIFALLSIMLWVNLMGSMLVSSMMTISFWMMFFIILSATNGLVLISSTHGNTSLYLYQ